MVNVITCFLMVLLIIITWSVFLDALALMLFSSSSDLWIVCRSVQLFSQSSTDTDGVLRPTFWLVISQIHYSIIAKTRYSESCTLCRVNLLFLTQVLPSRSNVVFAWPIWFCFFVRRICVSVLTIVGAQEQNFSQCSKIAWCSLKFSFLCFPITCFATLMIRRDLFLLFQFFGPLLHLYQCFTKICNVICDV